MLPLKDRLAGRPTEVSAWVAGVAKELGVPPYVIFHDSVLRDMTGLKPTSLAALGELPGVGAAKLEKHGEAFLAVIREVTQAV